MNTTQPSVDAMIVPDDDDRRANNNKNERQKAQPGLEMLRTVAKINFRRTYRISLPGIPSPLSSQLRNLADIHVIHKTDELTEEKHELTKKKRFIPANKFIQTWDESILMREVRTTFVIF